MTRFWHRYERLVWAVIVLVAVLVLWEIYCRAFGVRAFILPAPSLVFAEMFDSPGYFLRHSGYTVLTTLAGFALAVVIGVVCAIGIVYSPFLDRTLYTLLVALNSVPKVALAPLFVIWMGTGSEPKIAIALLIAIFPIVIDTVLGLKSVEPEMLDLARSARARPIHILTKIRLQSALPSMFAGMKVAISFALIGAIVGEFVAGEIGLGHVILISQGMFDTPRVFAAILLLGVIGTMLFYAVDFAERWLLPWHVSQRGNGRGGGH